MMKFLKHILVILPVALVFWACGKYDDTDLREQIASLDKRVASLEERVSILNGDIMVIQALVGSVEKSVFVTSVKETTQGYEIIFSDGTTISIRDGKDGTDGVDGKDGNDGITPQIGVCKDDDGIWYWTLNGEWLLNGEGEKCPVTGKDGDDGKDGKDGKDGITPQMIIEDGYWYISSDNGETWTIVGKAAGGDGKDGESLFEYISQDSHFVYLRLADGTVLQLTKFNSSWEYTESIHCIENEPVNAYLQVVYNNADYSYSRADYLTASSLGRDFDLPRGKTIMTDVDSQASSRTLEYADNPGFIHCQTITLDLSSNNYTLYDLEGEKVYYYRVFKDNDPYLILNSGKFQTTGTVRFIFVDAIKGGSKERIKNVRDIGGWKVGGNRRIRYGMVFRGSETNHITNGVLSSFISNLGIKEMKDLGITAQLDLREAVYAENDQGKIWNSIHYSCFSLDQWFYRLNIYCTVKNKATAYANAIRQLISWLKEDEVVYINCQGGCDRTGALCAVIEGICGVSENDINHDYELSRRDRSREYFLREKGDKYDGDFKFAMEYIKGLLKYNNHIYVYYRGNYYDAEKAVAGYSPVPIVDSSLIEALSQIGFGTLQERFRLLMEIGGLTPREMDELENLLCS